MGNGIWEWMMRKPMNLCEVSIWELIAAVGFLSGVLTAESRAAQYKYQDIESAAAHLHGMLEELM
jgi:hypothetical protein